MRLDLRVQELIAVGASAKMDKFTAGLAGPACSGAAAGTGAAVRCF